MTDSRKASLPLKTRQPERPVHTRSITAGQDKILEGSSPQRQDSSQVSQSGHYQQIYHGERLQHGGSRQDSGGVITPETTRQSSLPVRPLPRCWQCLQQDTGSINIGFTDAGNEFHPTLAVPALHGDTCTSRCY